MVTIIIMSSVFT